jgi:hypothetical protein
MHPTLAAMVCIETVKIAKSNLLTFFKANSVKGINIIRETSLVMKIEEKKHVKIKNNTSPRVFLTLTSNLRTSISKTLKFFKTSTTSIITKSNMIVSQLI